MTKTKAQLRAEAVERLRTMDEWCDEPHTSYDLLKAMLGNSLYVSDKEKTRAALIYLLTKERETDVSDSLHGSNDGMEPESDVSDSREKLEADIEQYLSLWLSDCMFSKKAIHSWLDRQAAIDRREFQTILEEIQKCMRNGNL